MAKPKPSIASRMGDGYFRRTDETPTDRESEGVNDPRNKGTDEPKREPASEDKATAGPVKAKRSYMLPATAVVTLERVQLADLIRTGEKPDLSELVTEAIALLAKERGVSGA